MQYEIVIRKSKEGELYTFTREVESKKVIPWGVELEAKEFPGEKPVDESKGDFPDVWEEAWGTDHVNAIRATLGKET